MTHKTGARPEVLAKLQASLWDAVLASGCTISEMFEAMDEVQRPVVRRMLKPWKGRKRPAKLRDFEALHVKQMAMVRALLAPWEDETCPTCPKDDAT